MAKKKTAKKTGPKAVAYDIARDVDGCYLIAPRLSNQPDSSGDFYSVTSVTPTHVCPRQWHRISSFRLKKSEGPVRVLLVDPVKGVVPRKD